MDSVVWHVRCLLHAWSLCFAAGACSAFTSDPCGDHGKCIGDLNAGALCECDIDYSGIMCQINSPSEWCDVCGRCVVCQINSPSEWCDMCGLCVVCEIHRSGPVFVVFCLVCEKERWPLDCGVQVQRETEFEPTEEKECCLSNTHWLLMHYSLFRIEGRWNKRIFCENHSCCGTSCFFALVRLT